MSDLNSILEKLDQVEDHDSKTVAKLRDRGFKVYKSKTGNPHVTIYEVEKDAYEINVMREEISGGKFEYKLTGGTAGPVGKETYNTFIEALKAGGKSAGVKIPG